eukprot:6198029-Pleurochrysis_carterae.AAC.2
MSYSAWAGEQYRHHLPLQLSVRATLVKMGRVEQGQKRDGERRQRWFEARASEQARAHDEADAHEGFCVRAHARARVACACLRVRWRTRALLRRSSAFCDKSFPSSESFTSL